MRRALSSSWTLLLTVLWIGLCATPVFAGKATVAILGLEVVDTSGAVDPEAVKVAKELTDGLRARAKVGSGPYVLAPGSDKELIDEKLIKNCDTEAMPCMSQIGKDLGANYLMYGRLEKRGDGYQVQINLLNVDKKKFEKTKTPLTIPFAQKDSASLAAAAKRAYNDLTGVVESGSLVVTSNAPDGEVFLDEQSKGRLDNGSLTIDKLAEGRYRLAIQSDKWERGEVVVTIRSGEATPQTLDLKPLGDMKHTVFGTTSQKKSSRMKPIAIGLAVLTLAAGGVWIYSSTLADEPLIKSQLDELGIDDANVDTDDCGKAAYEASPAFKSGCNGYKASWVAGSVTVAAGLGFLITGYFAIRSGETEPPAPATTRRRAKKRTNNVSITPLVSPDGGGATFRLDW
ncbi:MAG: PEGA domain-containing protein [Kofleriaceae bacterium]